LQRTKFLSGSGCFKGAIGVIPIVYFSGKFIYDKEFKEKTLVGSRAPNHIHTIEVVEKGEPAWFGPSQLKLNIKTIKLLWILNKVCS